jgi:hypothetical protein
MGTSTVMVMIMTMMVRARFTPPPSLGYRLRACLGLRHPRPPHRLKAVSSSSLVLAAARHRYHSQLRGLAGRSLVLARSSSDRTAPHRTARPSPMSLMSLKTMRRIPGMRARHAALVTRVVTTSCCYVRRARRSGAGLEVATIWLVINSLVSMGVYIRHDTHDTHDAHDTHDTHGRECLTLIMLYALQNSSSTRSRAGSSLCCRAPDRISGGSCAWSRNSTDTSTPSSSPAPCDCWSLAPSPAEASVAAVLPAPAKNSLQAGLWHVHCGTHQCITFRDLCGLLFAVEHLCVNFSKEKL